MKSTDAIAALDRAEHLSSQARETGRWYAGYLVAFAFASLIVGTLFGFVDDRNGALILTAVWLVFVAALTGWQLRKRTVVRGMGRIHGLVIGAWAALWSVTVVLGTTLFVRQLPWWIAGGVTMAIPPLVGAWVVVRRTRR